MQDKAITLDDGRTVQCISEGSGQPLLLIHGIGSDRRQFVDLAGRLAPGIEAVAYDQRDTGEQISDRQRYSMEDLADDAADLMTALGWSSAHVLGTSFGGAIAQHLAVRYPERVRTLVLVSTTATHASTRTFADGSTAMTADERALAMLDAAVSPAARASDPSIVETVRAALVRRPDELHARRLAALAGHDTTDVLGSIQMPTLVVHGTDDTVIPYEAGCTLAEQIPDAVFWSIKGARHATAFECADELARRVSQRVLQF
ncbi:alpha/beta fold hydrolase [Williamsia soli]|uniref:alpha/beta fold hydrolase n=1 Tax=Williamsia soli TaxID=364929 RepID=UPI001A9EBD7B|nr:alpha/beta hydrolase [Williamsia soli]